MTNDMMTHTPQINTQLDKESPSPDTTTFSMETPWSIATSNRDMLRNTFCFLSNPLYILITLIVNLVANYLIFAISILFTMRGYFEAMARLGLFAITCMVEVSIVIHFMALKVIYILTGTESSFGIKEVHQAFWGKKAVGYSNSPSVDSFERSSVHKGVKIGSLQVFLGVPNTVNGSKCLISSLPVNESKKLINGTMVSEMSLENTSLGGETQNHIVHQMQELQSGQNNSTAGADAVVSELNTKDAIKTDKLQDSIEVKQNWHGYFSKQTKWRHKGEINQSANVKDISNDQTKLSQDDIDLAEASVDCSPEDLVNSASLPKAQFEGERSLAEESRNNIHFNEAGAAFESKMTEVLHEAPIEEVRHHKRLSYMFKK